MNKTLTCKIFLGFETAFFKSISTILRRLKYVFMLLIHMHINDLQVLEN